MDFFDLDSGGCVSSPLQLLRVDSNGGVLIQIAA